MHRHPTTDTLAVAVAQLMRPFRRAMLAAVQGERIITGAYADDDGRMCPLLAAHRYGVRESGGFVEAHDSFCGGRRGERREATKFERALLPRLLQDGLRGRHAERARRFSRRRIKLHT